VVLLPTWLLKLAITAKFDGVVEFDEELRSIDTTNKEGEPVRMVMGRSGEIKINNDAKTGKTLVSTTCLTVLSLNVKDGQKIGKGDHFVLGILTMRLFFLNLTVKLNLRHY
jgi:DNA-directed RNA polymerase subunit beta'